MLEKSPNRKQLDFPLAFQLGMFPARKFRVCVFRIKFPFTDPCLVFKVLLSRNCAFIIHQRKNSPHRLIPITQKTALGHTDNGVKPSLECSLEIAVVP